MRKFLSMLFAGALLFAISLSGCGSDTKTSQSSSVPSSAQSSAVTTSGTAQVQNVALRIAWWGNQARNDRTQKVMDLYHQNNPNVTLQGEFVEWNGYWPKLATQAAANDLPDVIQMDYSYLDQYVDKSLLLDLTPYTGNGVLDISSVSDNSVGSGKVNNGLYAISLGTNAYALAYDAAAFQKAGLPEPASSWTWQDYEDTITQVYKATGLQAESFVSNIGGFPTYTIQYYLRQNGYPLYGADGTTLGFTDPKLVQFIFDQEVRLTKAGVYPSPEKLPTSAALEDGLLAKGQAFIGACWSNQFVALSNASKRPLKMISLPLLPDGKAMGLYDKPAMFFSVISTTKNKDDSVKFINYFTNDIDANKILLAERGVPVSSKVRDGIKSSVDQYTAISFDYINQIDNIDKLTGPIDPPQPAGDAEIQTLLNNLYFQVDYGKMTPEAAAEAFMKQTNDILAKNKK